MVATTFDLKLLCANDPRLTSIILTFSRRQSMSQDEKELFQDAFRRNTNLKDVAIYVDASFGPSGDMEDYTDILSDIGRLPALKKLSVRSCPRIYSKLQVRELVSLLRHGKNLENVYVSDLELIGSEADFAALANAMQNMWCLRQFLLNDIELSLPNAHSEGKGYRAELPNTASGCILDPLVTSLSLLPSLVTFTLNCKTNTTFETISSFALSCLFISSSMRVVSLENLGLSEDHLACIAGTLRGKNHQLRHLDIGPVPSLSLPVARCLSEMMKDNVDLLYLEIGMSNMIEDSSAACLAQGLKVSKSLRTFKLLGNKLGRLSKACKDSFIEALEHNYLIGELVLFRSYRKASALQSSVRRLLRLNSLGRGDLLESPGNDGIEWVNMLSKTNVNQDLDSVFYFLSNNPSLFCSNALASPAGYKAPAPKRKETCDDDLLPPTKKLRISTQVSM